MTSINTTDDLLQAARANQEFREEFRRLILTEELVDVPGQLKELTAVTANLAATGQSLLEHAATTNQHLGSINERITELVSNSEAANTRMDAIQNATEANAKGISDLLSGIAEVNRNVKEIRNSHRTEHNALHRFRGNYAIEATRNNDSNMAELFANVRGINRFRLRTLTREQCDDLLDDYIDAIDLLNTEGNIWKTFPTGDIIAEASHRRSRDTIFYIAVEASYTVNADDVVRASDHAKILRGVTGHEAFAIVSGIGVNPEIGDTYRQRIIYDLTEYMESKQDNVVFWFQLADRSLEPPPPC